MVLVVVVFVVAVVVVFNIFQEEELSKCALIPPFFPWASLKKK